MGKKKMTKLSNVPSANNSNGAVTTNISQGNTVAPQFQLQQSQQPLFEQQDTLHKMLYSTNHTHRIDALNTISSLLKSYNAHSIAHNNLFQRIVELMTDKMMNVALAATSVIRHVVQVCDAALLNFFIANSLQSTCFTLLQHIVPLYRNFFVKEVVITKGHGLYWYNPNYLTMVRLLCHIVKILSALFEVNDNLVKAFMESIVQIDQTLQQPTPPQTDPSGECQQPVQNQNLLLFFFELLTINLSTIQPALLPTVHLPFITNLHLELYHFLRVLSHENGLAVNYFLANANIIQFLIQQPLLLLKLQQTTTTTMQCIDNANIIDQSQQRIIECESDSVYTYQYCQSIALSNLYNEYTKVVTNSKKTSALATTFHIYSNPHSNLELAMSIVMVIANILQFVNLTPQTKNTPIVVYTPQQLATIESLYTTIMSVMEYNITKINLQQELFIYNTSLQNIHTILMQISNGDMTLLQNYNLNSNNNNDMSETISKQNSSKQHQQQLRHQFKMLNVNSCGDQQQQHEMLLLSLQQLSAQRDGAHTQQFVELDQLSAPMDDAMVASAETTTTDDSGDYDDELATLTMDQHLANPAQAAAAGNPYHNNKFSAKDGDFPLQQLWNDAIYIHNTILQQYFNIKTLLGDAFTMLFSDFVEEYSNSQADQDDPDEMRQFTQRIIKKISQSPQHSLLHKSALRLLNIDILVPLLNHSYAHINHNTTTSYYPSTLIQTIFSTFALCQNPQSETLQYISTLSYQNTMLRISSMNNFLFLLQFNNITTMLDETHAASSIFNLHAATLHDIILTIITSTPLSQTVQSAQKEFPLLTLERQFQYFSNLDTLIDQSSTTPTAAAAALLSQQQQQQQQQLDPNGVLQGVFMTTIDEALLLIQTLTTFVNNTTLIKFNKTLWKHPSLLGTRQKVGTLKDLVYMNESLTQVDITNIIHSFASTSQQQVIAISEKYATKLFNFLSYFLTAQQLYQKQTGASHMSAAGQEKLQKDSPHVEFQYYVIDYVTTMSLHYPLFGPLMSANYVPQLFLGLLQAFGVLKSTQFNCQLLFAIVNLIIDVYSEDDRYVQSYTQVKLTTALQAFAKTHTEYLGWLKQMKMSFKLPAKKGTKLTAAQQVEIAAKQKQFNHINQQFEITTEANQNLTAFIQYKKGLKL